MKKIFGLLLFAVAAAGAGLLRAADPPAVRVETGLVSGVADANGVTAYKGIPFAAPPLGPLRWKAPQPASPWEGVRAADHFGNACFQIENHSRLPWTEPFMEQGPVSEDCLYLNLWTAAKSPAERRPVMVYVYGGGFNEGAGSIAAYDGAQLARRGVVLVTFNYRVQVLGYLAHPELAKESGHGVSGNYGLLDQIAAVAWVHRNIAAFGGDPNRVTIFGQSAGAISVYDLMQSPLAKGLFARAIIESGPGLLGANALGSADTLADREQAGAKWAEARGAHSLADLRTMAPADLFAPAGRGGPPARFAPVPDGWALPLPGAEPQHEAPVIVGMVADDIGVASSAPAQTPTVASYEESAKRKYGALAEEYLKLYPAASDADVLPMLKAATRDQARVSIDLWATSQEKHSPRVYTYYFDRAIPWPEHPEFGAFHTSEVPYVFENLALSGHPTTEVDQKVSDTVSQYWINFASTGDPSGKGVPQWPAHQDAAHTTMELGAQMGPMPVATPERLAFQQKFLSQPPPAAAGPGR